MNKDFTERVSAIKEKFLALKEGEERYSYLIELGRKAAPYPAALQTAEFVVPGCQSVLYLQAEFANGALFFRAYSEALISAGLGALLIELYNGCDPRTILLNPPTFLQEIGLLASLSPSRSNGLASIYLKMKHIALTFIHLEVS